MQDTRFTEYEIVQLWTTFKKEFPKGKINKRQLRDLIKVIFPRGAPDLFVDNIFRIFDPGFNGSIRFGMFKLYYQPIKPFYLKGNKIGQEY